jgi:hypothetical protein
MLQRLFAHRAAGNLNPVMLFDSLGGTGKGGFRTEVGQPNRNTCSTTSTGPKVVNHFTFF